MKVYDVNICNGKTVLAVNLKNMSLLQRENEKLKKDVADLLKIVNIWKSRSNAHEQNYLQMLKRIDEIVAAQSSKE